MRDAAAQLDFAGEVRGWAPQPIGAVFNNAGVAVASSVLDAVPEDDAWLALRRDRRAGNRTRYQGY